MRTRSFPNADTTSKANGFTLLELLLVIGMTAILMLSALQVAQGWLDRERAKGAGDHLQRVIQTTEQFLDSQLVNIAGAGATPRDNIIEAIVNIGATEWAALREQLIDQGLLDDTTNLIRSPAGITYQLAFRTTGASPDRTFHTMIYSTERLANQQVIQISRQGGSLAGQWTSLPNANFFRGAFGQWQVASTVFITLTLPPPTQTQGYLVGMIIRAESVATGPYLYRQSIGGNPDLNTMNADLNLNGNDLAGVGTLQATTTTVGSLTVQNSATLSDLTVTNSLTSLGQTQIQGDMTVDGSITLSNGTISADALTTNCLILNGNSQPPGCP